MKGKIIVLGKGFLGFLVLVNVQDESEEEDILTTSC